MIVKATGEFDKSWFALVKGTLDTPHNFRDDYVSYSFNSYFISKSGGTKGSLCYGQTLFTLYEPEAHLDNLMSYKNLTEEEVLKIGDKKRSNNSKDFKQFMTFAFGNGNVWTSGKISDNSMKSVVDAWFDLPNAPIGTYGWMKVINPRTGK